MSLNAQQQFETLKEIIAGGLFSGPFADDTAAATGGVEIGQAYYLPTGAVQVRLS